MATAMSDYRPPDYLKVLSQEKGVVKETLGRLKEMLSAGQAFVQSQPQWQEIPRAYEVLSADDNLPRTAGYSNVSVNRIKRNFRDLVATISNLKPSGRAVTKHDSAVDSVWRLNQMKDQWWITTQQDRRYREACQYACALGTGYLEPWFDNNFYGYGRGEISCKVHGPSSVWPVMLTEDYSLQKSYAVTIEEQVPLHIVAGSYPAYAHEIEPSRGFPGWAGRALDAVRGGARGASAGVLGSLNTPQHGVGREFPTVRVYTTYIMDTSVNNSGQPVQMGDPGTSWYYRVPFMGQEIPSGVRDIQGRMIMRRANEDDCRLFPLRRRVIWTDTCVLRDGTSPYLHGKVPLVQLRFDDYPWEFLGTGIVHDTWRVQRAINQIYRAIVDSVMVRLEPPLKYDPNQISKAAMSRLNTRRPRQTLESSMGMGPGVEPVLPIGHWDVPAWILQVLEMLKNDMDQMSLVKDLMAVAKAKQIPSADSIEKILEAAGPVVQDIARGGEVATQQFDALWYPMAIQFWDAHKVFSVLGENGAIKETLDWNPGSLIPSHLPGENQREDSIYDKWERARWTVEQMSYVIEPYSQAQVSRVGRNLLFFQLFKAGFPIGPYTIGKNMGLNMGEPPAMRDGTPAVTEIDQWTVFQETKSALAEDLQGGQPGGQQGAGRPPTNKKPGRIQQKDGGTRTTIATS